MTWPVLSLVGVWLGCMGAAGTRGNLEYWWRCMTLAQH